MKSIKLTIPVEPKAQMRARHTMATSRSGRAYHQAYKHEKQISAETSIELHLLPKRPKKPIEGPVYFGMKCFLPIPKRKSKAWIAAAIAGDIRPVKVPDLDNLAKQIKDCLTRAGFWLDDRQVVEYLPGTGKWYSETPRWEIEIKW